MMHSLPAFASRLLLILAVLLGGCATRGRLGPAERMLVAEVALDRGQYPIAAREYRLAAVATRDDRVAERAARVAFDHGQDRALVEIARAWRQWAPDSEAARRFAVVGLLELDDRAAAERELGILIRTAYATPAEAFAALTESLSELRNDTGVAYVVERLAAAYGDLPEGQLAAGTLLLSAGNSPAALAAADRALALRAGWREARWLRARARVAGGDCTDGLAEAGELAAESTDADQLVYAWLLSACDRGAQAQPYFADLARGRAAAEALEGLAALDVEAHRWDDAAARYNQMLATGRHTERAVYGLGVVADRRGEAERAIRLYGRVTVGPRAVAAQVRAYRLLLETADRETAARQLDEFVATVPEYRIQSTAGRAQVLLQEGRGAEALDLLTRALGVYPDRMELRFARATVLERAGDVDGAVRELRAIVADRPLDPTAQNALGFTLADHQLALPEAERRVRAALAQRPDSAAIKDSLGWVLHRRGQTAEGVQWLRQAYAGEPDPEVAAHLGEAEWALGDHAAAVATWTEALARNPGDARLKLAVDAHPVPDR